mmetsp:Transcript_26776/g.63851  ORF Transcript_26776/g.63851 Transcript_26776/m.63851 type:complete len:82 (-) Transcript_26776:1500-1745(-)
MRQVVHSCFSVDKALYCRVNKKSFTCTHSRKLDRWAVSGTAASFLFYTNRQYGTNAHKNLCATSIAFEGKPQPIEMRSFIS